MKYIDAEKIPWTDLNDGRGGVNVYVTFLEKVARMPAADVVEVKHGRWIIDREFGNDVMSDEQMVICSECGKGIFWGKQNYCPNCGAKMDGKSKCVECRGGYCEEECLK